MSRFRFTHRQVTHGPWRSIRTADPRVRVRVNPYGAASAELNTAPTDDGWALARQLPRLVREAMLAWQATRPALTRMHRMYRARQR